VLASVYLYYLLLINDYSLPFYFRLSRWNVVLFWYKTVVYRASAAGFRYLEIILDKRFLVIFDC